MRFLNKYKHSNTAKMFLKHCSIRVLKFKKSKWKILHTRFKSKKKNTPIFCDHLLTKTSYKRWDKVKLHYREGLDLKRSIFKFFDNSLSIKHFKTIFKVYQKETFSPLISMVLIKPLFKLDILLWKLCLCDSVHQVRQFIQQGLIKLNGLTIIQSKDLRVGDMITFTIAQKYSFNRNFKNSFLNACVEIDYYTGSIVVLKDFNQLTREDLSTLGFDAINFHRFIDYIDAK